MSCELILALDLPDRETAAPILKRLQGSLRWVKIGLQMFTAYGPDYVRETAGSGFQVFLDLKLHDIPHTVGRAVESLSSLPIGMLTLHASGGREMLAAAKSAARPDLLLLGVTVLTSFDRAGLAAVGIAVSPPTQVKRLSRVALEAGIGGLVCSPLEVALLRKQIPAEVRLVTPGIRPSGPGRKMDDQKRVMTPAEAARAGSDFIVVGRPILQADDPLEAVAGIVAELESAR